MLHSNRIFVPEYVSRIVTETTTTDGIGESSIGENERDERGRFQQRFTDEEMLTFIRDAPEPAQTARSVADQFGVERPTVHERLHDLLDEERVEHVKLSPRVVTWWVPDEKVDDADVEPATRLGDDVPESSPEIARRSDNMAEEPTAEPEPAP